MKKISVIVIICLMILPLTFLTGCTQSNTGKYTVSIDLYAFDPSNITITKGATVTWTNNDQTQHTVTSNNFDSGRIDPGNTYSHTFNDAGTFIYHCEVHPYMVGIIIVQ